MEHLALYREFRPKTFDEVLEQTHIVKTLTHQIETGSVGHAYLFCGTRGTGKTSIAKIFAKAVNCLSPKNGSPCGECAVCKALQENGNLDVIEIDAASNNRVDEIRDLREKVGYLPSVGKYRVYIIDEVHMLTDSAFNALLKTLEEPPSHIIFILATTEPEKLPATILSRCTRLDFKLVSVEGLTNHLKNIFEKTNTKYELDALKLIAKAGKGSVRDTLSVAEMCKAFSAENVTYASVVECLGVASDEIILNLSKAIANKDGGEIISIVDKLYESGKNLNLLLTDLCEMFKNAMLLKLAPNYDIEQTEFVQNGCKQIANSLSQNTLLNILKTLSDGAIQAKSALNSKIFIQTTLLSTIYSDNAVLEDLANRVERLENSKNITNQNIESIEKKTENLESVETKSEKQITESLQNNSAGVLIKKEKIEVKVNNFSGSQNIDENEKISKNDENLSKNTQKNEQSIQIFEQTPFSTDADEAKNSGNHLAKQIFGEFIRHTRESNQMLLFASLADVKDVSVENSAFVFICASADCKNALDEHKEFVENFLESKFKISKFQTKIFVDSEKEAEKKLFDMLDGKLEIVW